MLGDPRSRSQVWETLDWEIGKPGENRGQVVAHWEFQPAAAFHDRHEGSEDYSTGSLKLTLI
jgi:hypothetical protein